MGKLRASVDAVIERDVDAVFEYVSDLSTMDDWVVGISNTRLVAGADGEAGAVYEFDYAHGDGTVPMQVEVTAMETPDRIAMR